MYYELIEIWTSFLFLVCLCFTCYNPRIQIMVVKRTLNGKQEQISCFYLFPSYLFISIHFTIICWKTKKNIYRHLLPSIFQMTILYHILRYTVYNRQKSLFALIEPMEVYIEIFTTQKIKKAIEIFKNLKLSGRGGIFPSLFQHLQLEDFPWKCYRLSRLFRSKSGWPPSEFLSETMSKNSCNNVRTNRWRSL